MNFKQPPYVPGWPKGSQRPAKVSPRALQRELREPKERPKGAQGFPKGSKGWQSRPRGRQRHSKDTKRKPEEAKGKDIYQKTPDHAPKRTLCYLPLTLLQIFANSNVHYLSTVTLICLQCRVPQGNITTIKHMYNEH